MDHRRLAEYLVKIYPKDYKICKPLSINPNIHEFLENLYGLTSNDYKKLLDTLDMQSKITWWRTMQIRYQRYSDVIVRVFPYVPKNISSSNGSYNPKILEPRKQF